MKTGIFFSIVIPLLQLASAQRYGEQGVNFASSKPN